MKNSNTKLRLRQIMDERRITQTDILKAAQPYCEKFNVKLSKSNMSQYVSGKNEPGQDKIAVLSMALDVSEGWLMGYDVPMERKSREENKKPAEDGELAEDMAIIAELVSRLTPEQLDPVITMIENMPRLNPDQLSSIAEVIKNMAK